jgi:hypothetical protein
MCKANVLKTIIIVLILVSVLGDFGKCSDNPVQSTTTVRQKILGRETFYQTFWFPKFL